MQLSNSNTKDTFAMNHLITITHHMPHDCHVLPRLLWLCCYMSQMNPLIGPELDRKALAAMSFYWGNLHE